MRTDQITVYVTPDGCIVPEGTPGASPVTVTAPAEGSIKVGLVNALVDAGVGWREIYEVLEEVNDGAS
jgi:hypothetical protein